ncbi:MAG TPA: DUF3987 domain-containing protein [Phycisphaeraceae bacterium]
MAIKDGNVYAWGDDRFGALGNGDDPSYIAQALLGVCASCIGNTRVVRVKDGWHEPAVVWPLIVGESGSMKSPAFKAVLKPLREIQTRAMREYDLAMQQYEAEMAEHERQMARWMRQKMTDEPPPTKPLKPQPVRFIVHDTTIEALIPLFQANPRGLLLALDELAGWFGAMDRYAATRGGDVAHWLSMHGAEPIIADRKSSGTILVPRAAISIIGCIQPTILSRMLGQVYWENGLAARLLLAMPPRKIKRWTQAGIPPQIEARLAQLVEKLLELRGNENAQTGALDPVPVDLSPEARTLFIEFYNAHAEEQIELTGDLAAAWSKLEAYAPRLALVIHHVRMASGEPVGEAIDAESMRSALVLVQWYKNETRRVYKTLSEAEEDRTLRQLWELVQAKGGSMSGSELVRASRQYNRVADAEQALNKLAQAGLGQWVYPPQEGRGRPPARRLVLNQGVNETSDSSFVYTVNVNKNPSGGAVSGHFIDVDIVDTPENGGSVDGDNGNPGEEV